MVRSCEASLKRLKTDRVELYLLHWCFKQGISVMAYSPVEQGRILGHKVLKQVAQRLGATPAQVALAGVLRQDGVVAIPKAGSVAHVRENRKALDLKLDAQALSALDQAFPPPKRARSLEML